MYKLLVCSRWPEDRYLLLEVAVSGEEAVPPFQDAGVSPALPAWLLV